MEEKVKGRGRLAARGYKFSAQRTDLLSVYSRSVQDKKIKKHLRESDRGHGELA